MRHEIMRSQKWLHRARLTAMLLAAGLLCAPLTPVQSEASGTLVQVQSGPNPAPGGNVTYDTLATITITSSTCPSGFSRCFALSPGTYGSVAVDHVPGTTAKLLILDVTGAGGALDKIQLSGVKFTPTSANRTVKVKVTHRFDDAANSGGGNYQVGWQMGGYFQNSDGTNYNDFVKLSAALNGTKVGPDLTHTVGGAASLTNPYSLRFSSPYPSIACASPCTPTAEATLTFVILGTDSLNLTNSADGAGGDCNLTPQGPPGGTAARPCHGGPNSLENRITAQLADWQQADLKSFATLPGPVGQLNEACSEGCTQDPDIINPGTLTIRKHIDYCPYYGCSYPEEFSFLITGNVFQIVTVTTNTNSNQDGEISVSLYPGTYFVQEIAKPFWYLSNTNNCAPGDTGVDVQSGSTGICQFNNSPVGGD